VYDQIEIMSSSLFLSAMAVVAITATTLTTLKYYPNHDDNNASDYETYDDYDFSTESHQRHSPKFGHNRHAVRNDLQNLNDKHIVKRSSDEESITQYAIDDDDRNSSMADEAKRNKVKEVHYKLESS
jgi:hypothetical protein